MKLQNTIFQNGFIDSLKELNNHKLPIKESYKLVKFIKEVEEKAQSFEESRKSLIEKYGEQQEDGNTQVKEDNIQDFYQEFQELLEIKEEYSDIKINLPNDIEIEPKHIYNLESILDLNEE